MKEDTTGPTPRGTVVSIFTLFILFALFSLLLISLLPSPRCVEKYSEMDTNIMIIVIIEQH